MKKNRIIISASLVAALSLMAINCSDFDSTASESIDNQTAGSADFTTYVALGNSLTSGYVNSALYKEGQENAYPAMLAKRFSQAFPAMTEFKTPLVADNNGGLLLSGVQIATPKLVLNESFSPVVSSASPTTDISKNIGASGPYNNLGVPGAKSFHLLTPGYGSLSNVSLGLANPYYAYFSTSSTSTLLADALAQSPTFFTLWIGSNDVLSYATAGGDESGGVDRTGNLNPATYGGNDISDPNVVAGSIQNIVTALVNQGAKGVVANIPDIASIPYFTTVPYNAITLTAEQASALNSAYATYNGALNLMASNNVITSAEAAERQITFSEGAGNAVVFLDPSLTNLTAINPALVSMRQAKSGELLTLTSSSIIGTLQDPNNSNSLIGIGYPLDGKYVLTANEITKIDTAVSAYNAGINAVVGAFGGNVVLADMNTAMQELSASSANPKFLFDGVQYSARYISGSAFSLDGVHPTPKGYAIISNEYIKAINNGFGATLLPLDPNIYPGL